MTLKEVKCLEIQFFNIKMSILIYFKISPHSLVGNPRRSLCPCVEGRLACRQGSRLPVRAWQRQAGLRGGRDESDKGG
jgi:hypothetical protein